MGPDITEWVSTPPFWDLTDVTLVAEDTNSILTENANRETPGNVEVPKNPKQNHPEFCSDFCSDSFPEFVCRIFSRFFSSELFLGN